MGEIIECCSTRTTFGETGTLTQPRIHHDLGVEVHDLKPEIRGNRMVAGREVIATNIGHEMGIGMRARTGGETNTAIGIAIEIETGTGNGTGARTGGATPIEQVRGEIEADEGKGFHSIPTIPSQG